MEIDTNNLMKELNDKKKEDKKKDGKKEDIKKSNNTIAPPKQSVKKANEVKKNIERMEKAINQVKKIEENKYYAYEWNDMLKGLSFNLLSLPAGAYKEQFKQELLKSRDINHLVNHSNIVSDFITSYITPEMSYGLTYISLFLKTKYGSNNPGIINTVGEKEIKKEMKEQSMLLTEGNIL